MAAYHRTKANRSSILMDLSFTWLFISIFLLFRAVVLPDDYSIVEKSEPPEDAQWQRIHVRNNTVLLNEQPYSDIQSAFATLNKDDYISIFIDDGTTMDTAHHVFMVSQASQYPHVYWNKNPK